MAVLFEELIENIPAIFYRCKCDENWTMYYISDAVEQITGYPAKEFILNKTRTYTSVIHEADVDAVSEAVDSSVASNQPWEIEYRVVTKENKELWVSEKGIGIFDDSGELMYLDGFITNISQRKKIEEELELAQLQIYNLAYTDTITDLANRNLFDDRLKQLLSYSRRYKTVFAMMFIDLDGFKAVNDTHGHSVGDELLKAVGQRLSEVFRELDTVARFGGDEFLVLVSNIKSEGNLQILANKALSCIDTPIYVDDLKLRVTGSVGVVFSPRDGEDSAALMKNADIAMYRAKALGKNQISIFGAKN